MNKYCYVNNKIIKEQELCISPYDLGILRGYGVFDFMCTTPEQKPFLLHDHWMRLRNSAKDLQLTIPINKKEFDAVVNKLIKKNPYKKAAIRTVLTAGISENGMTPLQKPTFYILIQDIEQLLPKEKLYTTGAKIITHEFVRDNYTSKTTNYIEAVRLQKEKKRKDAIEILYHNKNKISECSTSNIFMVKKGKLYTPNENILYGITRKLVIKLAQKNNISIEEKSITPRQLLSADEVFLTGSAKHILPITKIDNNKIGLGVPGPTTKQITDIYFEYFNNY
jgi:branched-chain amino acid aminotransferase